MYFVLTSVFVFYYLSSEKVFMKPDTCKTDLENLYRLQSRAKLKLVYKQSGLFFIRCEMFTGLFVTLRQNIPPPIPQGGGGEIMDEETLKTPIP